MPDFFLACWLCNTVIIMCTLVRLYSSAHFQIFDVILKSLVRSHWAAACLNVLKSTSKVPNLILILWWSILSNITCSRWTHHAPPSSFQNCLEVTISHTWMCCPFSKHWGAVWSFSTVLWEQPAHQCHSHQQSVLPFSALPHVLLWPHTCLGGRMQTSSALFMYSFVSSYRALHWFLLKKIPILLNSKDVCNRCMSKNNRPMVLSAHACMCMCVVGCVGLWENMHARYIERQREWIKRQSEAMEIRGWDEGTELRQEH